KRIDLHRRGLGHTHRQRHSIGWLPGRLARVDRDRRKSFVSLERVALHAAGVRRPRCRRLRLVDPTEAEAGPASSATEVGPLAPPALAVRIRGGWSRGPALARAALSVSGAYL